MKKKSSKQTYLAIDLPPFEIFTIDDNDTIDGIAKIEMVDEVPLAQIDGDLPIGCSFFEHLHGDDENGTQAQQWKHG